MTRHKRSQKCQSYTSSEDPKDNTTCCDRCGKSVPKRYMWRHKQTIDCKWFPATQLNIPVEVASDMVAKLPDTLTFEEKLKDICDQYKDGYVTPVKEKKPWQIKNEQIKNNYSATSLSYGIYVVKPELLNMEQLKCLLPDVGHSKIFLLTYFKVNIFQ